MITQKFKGDDLELKMEEIGKTSIEICGLALDQFFELGGQASPFLLMLYDQGRMPFSQRIPRDSFVDFIREAITRFPFTGTFDSYVYILSRIFGDASGVLFNVPAPGKLEVLVNASAKIEYSLTVNESVDGAFVVSNLVDKSGNQLIARGVSGIDSEYKLNQLLAELIPGGVFTQIALAFFSLYNFIDNAGYSLVDNLGNQIVFIEH